MTPLDNSYTAHQIDVVRYSAGEAKKVDAFLLDLIEYLETRLAKEGDSIASKKRLQILLDDVKKRMSGELSRFTDEFLADIEPFVKSELAFNDKVFSAFSSPVTPTLEQALSAINNNPLLLNGSAVDFGAYTRGWEQKEVDRIAGVISNGYYSGTTTQQIARDVIGTKSAKYANGKLNLTKANAYSMAKTAVMHMSSQTKARFFEANNDIVVGEEVVATLDSHTSPYCRWADGKKYYYRDGKFPRPPYHIHCLPGDTNISTCSDVSNVYKRAYKGVFVKLVTASGKSIFATPNHPILTSRGWVAIKLINSGDKVAIIDRHESLSGYYENSVETKIGDLFGSLNVSGDSLFVAKRPATSEDFHGDSTDNNVDVISVNRESWKAFYSSFVKRINNGGLMLGADYASHRFGSFDDLGVMSNSAARRIMSCFGKFCNLLWSASCHSRELLLASIARINSVLFKNVLYGVMRDAEPEFIGDTTNANTGVEAFDDCAFSFSAERIASVVSDINTSSCKAHGDDLIGNTNATCDAFDGFTSLISLDEVVDVAFTEMFCHVYNLENADNWYLANGIITHNCRTTMAPLLSEEYAFATEGGTRPAVSGGKAERVSSDTTYYEWLKTQPLSTVQSALGKTQADIFLNAGLSPAEFKVASTTQLGKPLTLKEMAARNEEIASFLRNE